MLIPKLRPTRESVRNTTRPAATAKRRILRTFIIRRMRAVRMRGANRRQDGNALRHSETDQLAAAPA